ncbi:MAG: DUF2905 domain-containing protein [Candidatus Omnitrophota bacterium]|nr:DUF2905 domain-containing protein [Candidatus Omnitrophota bacterium]MDZ4242968.1 DUF2905 domain-containing protein [Candidatus Omnitrophota bacterium]
MGDIAKILVTAGLVLIFLGGLAFLAGKIPGMGKWPGDILLKKDNFTFYFPLTTSLVVSLVLSLLFFLWNRR